MTGASLTRWGFSPHWAAAAAAADLAGAVPGRVIRVDRGRVLLITDEGEQPATWRTPLPVAGGAAIDAPVIGDWGVATAHPGLWRLEAILPRRSQISRSVADGEVAAQLLAANVDLAFLVTGLDHDFNLRRIERYLVLAHASGVRPVVVLNKADLCPNAVERRAEVARLAPGVVVLALTALAEEAAAALGAELGDGQTAVFLGSSGAGKSTLINRLLGAARQATAPVRETDERGRHTTTRRELFCLPEGGLVIDTPGLREVGVWADADGLAKAFADVDEVGARCRFRDCRHEGEPGCAVAEAVDAGQLDGARVESYLRLRGEGEGAALRQDEHARRQQERHKFGNIRQLLREAERFKGRR